MRYLPLLLAIGLSVYAVIDCARTPSDEVQHLPKPLWILIILFAWFVGPIAWLLAGRSGAAPHGAYRRPLGPDDDPEFLRQLGNQWGVRRDHERRRPDGQVRKHPDEQVRKHPDEQVRKHPDEQVRKDDENPERPA